MKWWWMLVVVLLVPVSAQANKEPFKVKIIDGQWMNREPPKEWPSPFLSRFVIEPYQDLDEVVITIQFMADRIVHKDHLRAEHCAVTVSPDRMRGFHLVPIHGDHDLALWIPRMQGGERVYFTIGWRIIPLLAVVTMQVHSAQGQRVARWEGPGYLSPPQFTPRATFQAVRLEEACPEITVETVPQADGSQ